MVAASSRELVCDLGVQRSEDARTSYPCERGAGLLRYLSNPQETGVAKNSSSHSQNFLVEVCDVYRTRAPFAK